MQESRKFYESAASLHRRMKDYDRKADELCRRFSDTMGALSQKISGITATLPDKNSGLADFIDKEIAQGMAARLQEWERRQSRRAREKALRSKAGDNLLVIVYGKVKTGKSFLGNYVAGQAPAGVTPEFFVFDRAGKKSGAERLEEIEENGFRTDITECTSAIQGFEVPGLTWIDTPGLGSLTDANGRLAREYINAADLILFPVLADSPGRRSDLAEIAGLAGSGKEFCVLITKSDFYEEDEVDGELVRRLRNNTDEVRAEQETWVRREIAAALGRDADRLLGRVMSVSAMTAREYPAGSRQWRRSNMPALFDMLTGIIEKDAVRLRAQQPVRTVAAFLKESLEGKDGLVAMAGRISDRMDDLEKRMDRMTEDAADIVAACHGRVEIRVQELVQRAWREYRDGKKPGNLTRETGDIVRDELVTEISRRAGEMLADVTHGIAADFDFDVLPENSLEFREKTREITCTNEHTCRGAGRAGGGLAGAAAGFFLGGPFVAIVGGAVGTLIGDWIGDTFSKDRTMQVVVGDNLQEVEDQAIALAEKLLEEGVRQGIAAVRSRTVAPLVRVLAEIRSAITGTVEKINSKLA